MKGKIGIWAITTCIAMLMITSSLVISATEAEHAITPLKMKTLDFERQNLELQTAPVSVPQQRIAKPLGDPLFAYEGDQYHPSFGMSPSGVYMAAYRDDSTDNVIWTYDPEDGVYYELEGYDDFPSIKWWDGTRFFGTLVPDPFDCDGAAIYIFETTDPTDFETYSLLYWDWSDNGWSNMLDSEIACDNSQESWEWGFVSLVATTTYGDGVYNGPFISYQTAEDGYATISWYYGLDGCRHTDATIDHVKYKTYAVYDWLDPDTSLWYTVIRTDSFNNWDLDGNLVAYGGAGDLQKPAVDANNGNIVIVSESNEAGNQDIICLYGKNLETLQTSVVSADVGDETNPDIRHVEDTTFICTFVRGGKLYVTTTENAGASWSSPVAVGDNVVDEYGTSYIGDFASYGMYTVDNGNDYDIYMTELGGGADIPVIEIASISGGVGVSVDVQNTGTGDAVDIPYTITATGGLLGFINKETTGTVSITAGASQTLKLPMILGIGKVTVEVTVGSATESVQGNQILLFTLL